MELFYKVSEKEVFKITYLDQAALMKTQYIKAETLQRRNKFTFDLSLAKPQYIAQISYA
jgi:hypothetical protein